MKKSGLLLICVLFFSSCEQQTAQPFSSWDSNEDGVISRQEFQSQWNGVEYYGDWDENHDNQLDRQEWQTRLDEYYYDWDNDQLSVFNEWDQNGDQILTAAELGSGTFNYWDSNSDGEVSPKEFEERAGDQH